MMSAWPAPTRCENLRRALEVFEHHQERCARCQRETAKVMPHERRCRRAAELWRVVQLRMYPEPTLLEQPHG